MPKSPVPLALRDPVDRTRFDSGHSHISLTICRAARVRHRPLPQNQRSLKHKSAEFENQGKPETINADRHEKISGRIHLSTDLLGARDSYANPPTISDTNLMASVCSCQCRRKLQCGGPLNIRSSPTYELMMPVRGDVEGSSRVHWCTSESAYLTTFQAR